jgi:hypothetical protein
MAKTSRSAGSSHSRGLRSLIGRLEETAGEEVMPFPEICIQDLPSSGKAEMKNFRLVFIR